VGDSMLVHSFLRPSISHDLWRRPGFMPVTVWRFDRHAYYRMPVEAAGEVALRIEEDRNIFDSAGKDMTGYALALPSVGNGGIPATRNPHDELPIFCEAGFSAWADWCREFFGVLEKLLKRMRLPSPGMFLFEVMPILLQDDIVEQWKDITTDKKFSFKEFRPKGATLIDIVESMRYPAPSRDRPLIHKDNIEFLTMISLIKNLAEHTYIELLYERVLECFPEAKVSNRGHHKGPQEPDIPFLFLDPSSVPVHNPPGVPSPDLDLVPSPRGWATPEMWFSATGAVGQGDSVLDAENVSCIAADRVLRSQGAKEEVVLPWLPLPGMACSSAFGEVKVRKEYLDRVLSLVGSYGHESAVLYSTPQKYANPRLGIEEADWLLETLSKLNWQRDGSATK